MVTVDKISLIGNILRDIRDFNNYNGVNRDLFGHLLSIADNESLNKEGLALKSQIIPIEKDFGLYAGEIFERFEERNFIEEDDITTLLLYLSLVVNKKDVFLYDQQYTFEKKIEKYIVGKNAIILYYFLKDDNVFANINIAMSELDINLRIELLKEFIGLTLEEESFVKQSIDELLISMSKGFELSKDYFYTNFLSDIHEYTRNSNNKEVKKFAKYWICLDKGITKRRVEFLINFHKNQRPLDILMILMSCLYSRNWKPYSEIALSHYRVLETAALNLLIIRTVKDEKDKEIYKFIETAHVFKRIFNNELERKMIEPLLRRVTVDKLQKAINILELTGRTQSYLRSYIDFSEELKQQIIDEICLNPDNNKLILSETTSLDFKNDAEAYVVISVIKETLKDKEISDSTMSSLALYIKSLYNNNMFNVENDWINSEILLILYKLKDLDELNAIFKSFLTLDTIVSSNHSEFIKEYFSSLSYSEKSFGKLILEVSEIEDKNILVVSNSLIKLNESYLTKSSTKDNVNVEFVLYCLENVLKFSDRYFSQSNYASNLLYNKVFVELFNKESKEVKESFILKVDEAHLDRGHLYQTDEEYRVSKVSEMKALLNTYRSLNFLEKYESLEEGEQSILVEQLSEKSTLKNFVINHNVSALRLIKELIDKNKFDESAFWEIL